MRPLLLLGLFTVLASACRGQPPARLDERDRFAALVDSLVPIVERHSGLTFRQAPRAELRTRDEVRDYLLAKVANDMPEARLRGMAAAYRLLGLLPDTLDLRQFMVDLYTEQVAGYYDPDSATLYGVSGFDPLQGKLLVAHELVHALQDQYVPLDSILSVRDESDRQGAAQAVLEGQAMIVSLSALVPDPAVLDMPMFWEQARDQVRQQATSQPVFTRAPMVMRESMIFPYLDGTEFMHWWGTTHGRDTMPFGSRMPASSEQILHPDRYVAGDGPLRVRFATAADGVLHEDTLGELDLRILTAALTDQVAIGDRPPFGWGGDRYRVWDDPVGPAMVWVVVWDDAASADRFGSTTGRWLAERSGDRPGYRTAVEPVAVEGRPAHRITIAPVVWAGWSTPPAVTVGTYEAGTAR